MLLCSQLPFCSYLVCVWTPPSARLRLQDQKNRELGQENGTLKDAEYQLTQHVRQLEEVGWSGRRSGGGCSAGVCFVSFFC